MTLGLDAWPDAAGAASYAPPSDRPPDAPAWYRGDEVESQAFLAAMGIHLE